MQVYNHNTTTPVGVKVIPNPNVTVIKEVVTETNNAYAESRTARDEASKARVELFSDKKGQEQNRQYQEYLEGSIKENFETKVSLVEERIALMQEISEMRITLAQERADAELAIKKRQAEADIEYESTLKKIGEVKTNKFKLWVWRVLWPAVGAGCAALTYLLLNI